jgi:hypothetical protein
MNKRVFVASALAIAGVLILPHGSGAQAPSGDSVIGSGTLLQLPDLIVLFELDARSGPSGEDPSGRFFLSFPATGGSAEGSVVCLRVSGNTAVFGVDFAAGVFEGVFEAVDGSVDTLRTRPVDRVGPASCSEAVDGVPATVIRGDIVVTDAPPLPTSKDQCKNGGWRTYGVFENQGDCVSFVATGGKNQPGKKAG